MRSTNSSNYALMADCDTAVAVAAFLFSLAVAPGPGLLELLT